MNGRAYLPMASLRAGTPTYTNEKGYELAQRSDRRPLWLGSRSLPGLGALGLAAGAAVAVAGAVVLARWIARR